MARIRPVLTASGRATSNQRLVGCSSISGWEIFARSLMVLPRCGKLPPKHNRAHPRIAKPKPSLSTRKCRRMARPTFGLSSASALQPAGRRMPGWLGKRRAPVMFSTLHLTGPHLDGAGGKEKLSTALCLRGGQEIPRRFNARRSKLAVSAVPSFSRAVPRRGPLSFVLGSRHRKVCYWPSRRVRAITCGHSRCGRFATRSRGDLAIALAEAAVDRVHLDLANESRSCAHLVSAGVMCRIAADRAEPSRGRVALRR